MSSTSPTRPPTRRRILRNHPGFLSVCNVAASGLLGVVWMWVPLSLFLGGISALAAAGLGLVLLIPWFYLQRGVNWLERYRSIAVYNTEVVIPPVLKSRDTGFSRIFLNELYVLFSAGFWRATALHYVKMILGLTTGFIWGVFVVLGAGLLTFALNGDALAIMLSLDREQFITAPWATAIGVASLLLSLLVLVMAPYLDRALDRGFLEESKVTELAHELKVTDRARVGAIDAATNERLRIERDLHDGVQPTLVALSMKLGMAKAKLARDPEGALALVTEAHEASKAAIQELRQTVRGIHPAVLEDRGLDASVSALAARSVVPVNVDVELKHELSKEIEAVAYFVIAESITNANKYSHAHAITVTACTFATQPGGMPVLHIEVSDDGRGGARIVRDGTSTGLAGLEARVAAARGTLNINSPVGGPTLVTVEVPCAS